MSRASVVGILGIVLVIVSPQGGRCGNPMELPPNFRVLNEVAPNAIDWGQETGEWIELPWTPGMRY